MTFATSTMLCDVESVFAHAVNSGVGNGTDCVPCACTPAGTTREGSLTVPSGKISPTAYNAGYNPHPVLSVEVALPVRATSPDATTATWTFNGSVVDTVYYEDDGHALAPGDKVIFSIQVDASALDSGVYSFNLNLNHTYDSGGPETANIPGTVDVVNRLYSDPTEMSPHTSEFGAGWFLPELDRLIPAGGSDFNLITGANEVISAELSAGVTEPGFPSFTMLSYNSGAGVYVAEFADGSESWFDDAHYWIVKRIDRNGNERTYSYGNGGGDAANDELTSITDEWGRTMTFSYSGGLVDEITDFAGNVTQYQYNGSGRLTKVIEPDPDGGGALASPVTEYQYNGLGLIEKIIDPRSQDTIVYYDHARRVSQIVQACGGSLELQSYQSLTVMDQTVHGGSSGDPAALSLIAAADLLENTNDEVDVDTYVKRGFLSYITKYVDGLGDVTTYDRNANGLIELVTQEDPDEGGPLTDLETEYTYGSYGNVIQRHNADETNEYWGYESGTNWLNEYTDQEGRVTWYDLDADGNILTMTQVVGADDRSNNTDPDIVTTYTYTSSVTDVPDGLLASVLDAEGRTTLYDYAYNTSTDELTVTITYADGSADETTEVYHYDAAGNLLYMIDGLTRQTDYEYDALNRLTKITEPDPDGVGSATEPITLYRYDASGNLTHVTDPLGNITEYVFDTRSRPRQIIQPVADPEATPFAETQEHGDVFAYNGEWDDTGSSFALNSSYYFSGEEGGDITFKFDELDDDKKYQVLVRWVIPETEDVYDTNALFEVFAGASGTPLVEWHTDLNVAPVGLPDGSGFMWLSLGAYSPDNEILKVVLSGDDILVIDAVRIIEVGPVTQYQYNCVNDLIKVTDPLGNETNYDYDELNRLETVTLADPDGAGSLESPVYQFGYDGFSRLTSTTDPLGNITAYEYDEMGRLLEMIQPDPDGASPFTPRTTTYTYDLSGLLESITDPASRLTNFEYDDLRRLVKLIQPDPDGGGGDPRPEIEYGYDDVGNLTSVIDALDRLTEYDFDDLNRLETVTLPDADGNPGTTGDTPVWGYVYNDAGELVTVTDPMSRVTTYDFDDLGRLIEVLSPDPDGGGGQLAPRMNYTYDAVGNLLTATDREDNETSYDYDNLYRRTSVTNPNDETTLYGYDLSGNLLTLTDPETNVTTWGYDRLNRMTSETILLDSTPSSRLYEYDAAGNLERKTDRNGRIIEYQYDTHHRLLDENWLDEEEETIHTSSFEYTLGGEFDSVMENGVTMYNYYYDGLGRNTSTFAYYEGTDNVINWDQAFDAVGNRTQLGLSFNDGATLDFVNDYEYDDLNRLKKVTQQEQSGGNAVAEKRVDFTYKLDGQFDTIKRYESLTTSLLVAESSYSYDLAGRLSGLTHFKSTTTFAGYGFGYDAASRLLSFTNSQHTGENATYSYDDAGQLTGANYSTQDDESYDYDENGNRVLANGDTYDTGDQNRLDSDDTYDYEYDAEGNRTLRTHIGNGTYTVYQWDHRNRLTSVQDYSSGDDLIKRVDYAYDTFDRLIGKLVTVGVVLTLPSSAHCS